MLSPRAGRVGIVGFLSAAVAVVSWPIAGLTIDDAFITFRQAHRLSTGDLSFRPGVPVEASSSLLHTWLIAVLDLAGIEAETGSKVIGVLSVILCASAIAWLIAATRRHSTGSSLVPWLLPVTAALTSPWMASWWFMGLETPLWAASLVSAAVSITLLIADARSRSAFLVAVAACVAGTMTRPEAPLLLLPWLVALATIDSAARPRLIRIVIIVCATAAALGAFRLAVYGLWFPNPVYVKTPSGLLGSMRTGLRYGWQNLWHPIQVDRLKGAAVLLFGVLAVLPWVRPLLSTSRADAAAMLRRVAPAAMLAALQLAFCISVGGDWMPWGRFLVPAIPLLAIAVMAVGTPSLGRGPAILILAGTIASASAFMRVESERGNLALMRTQYNACWRPLADYLGQHGRADETLAAGDIGLPGYVFPGDVIDFFGLANPALTRRSPQERRLTADDVLGTRPEWALLYAGGPVTETAWPVPLNHYSTDLMRMLLADPRLMAEYRPAMACDLLVLARRR